MPYAQMIAAVVGTVANVSNINKAGKTMKSFGLYGEREMNKHFDELKKEYDPYMDAGHNAINTLNDIYFNENSEADYSSFYKSPDYEFSRDEGLKGVESRNSVGSLLSGRTLKEMTRFGQDHANKYYQGYVNNLGKIAGQGLDATKSWGQQGTHIKQAGLNYRQLGESAIAASYIARGQAIADGANQAAGGMSGGGGGGGGAGGGMSSGGGFGGFF